MRIVEDVHRWDEARRIHDEHLAGNNEGWWDAGPSTSGSDVLLVAVDGADGGSVAGYLLGERLHDFGVVQEMAVLPGRRGGGVGSALLARFAVDASEAGLSVVYVKPLPGAPGDLAGYYRQRGFTDDGPQGHLAGSPDEIVATIDGR